MQTREFFEHRLETVTGRAHRQGRFVADQCAGGEVFPYRSRGRVHNREVWLPGLVVDEQRNYDDHRVSSGNRLGVVRGGAQLPGGNQLGQVFAQVSLPGERLLPTVDGGNCMRIDVYPRDLVTLCSVLGRQRQAYLSHSHNSDFHGVSFLSRHLRGTCAASQR